MLMKRTRKAARKVNHSHVTRDLGALTTSKTRLKRVLADAKLLDPRSPTRRKRETIEDVGDRRLGPARVRPSVAALVTQRREIMREHDPKGEWRNDVEDLRTEYRAIRDARAKALAEVNAAIEREPKPHAPKRRGGPRRR